MTGTLKSAVPDPTAAHEPQSAGSQAKFKEEELRIVAAYARRKQAVSNELYSRLNPAHLYMEQEIEREALRLLRRFKCEPLDSRKVLEVGCGTGQWLRAFIQWGASPENLYGVELLEERIDEGRRLLPQAVTLVRANAVHLDFPDETMDIVAQFGVFSSILDSSTRKQVAQEMIRVLRPGGRVLWYDFHFNNPRNPDVRGVSKGEVQQLFPDCRATLCRITVAPPLARTLGRIWPKLYLPAAAMKFVSTHYLGLLEKQ